MYFAYVIKGCLSIQYSKTYFPGYWFSFDLGVDRFWQLKKSTKEESCLSLQKK